MMYTNKALALKVLFAALLPAVFMAVNLLMLEDSLAQLFSFLAAALLYFIPFYATYFTIRKTRPESLKGYFVKDILFLLFPHFPSFMRRPASFRWRCWAFMWG